MFKSLLDKVKNRTDNKSKENLLRNTMDKKIIIGLISGAAILGIIVIGLVFSTRRSLPTQTVNTISTVSPEPSPQKIEATTKEVESVLKVPTSTIAPYSSKIQTIDDQYVVITGTGGTVRLTKAKVKVFRRSGDQLIPFSLDDLKVGQEVTIKPVVPGKETHLIIEE